MATETTEAPLNPEVEASEQPEPLADAESQVDTQVDGEEVPPAPDYSRLLQREQMARANMEKKFEKKFDELLEAVKSGASPKVQQSKLDKLKEYMNSEEGRTVAASTPGLTKLLEDMAEETADAKRRAIEAEERQAQLTEFDQYMADKPPGFREAYTREQRRLMDECTEDGVDADETQLGIAMKQWEKRWLKTRTTAPAQGSNGGNVGKVLPTAGVKKAAPTPKPTGNPFGWTV